MADFAHFFFWLGGGQVGGRASDWGRNAPLDAATDMDYILSYV